MNATAYQHLHDVIDRLIAPDGCPWDREQTPESLSDYFIEESNELADAIRSGNPDEVRSELGDLAFLMFFLGRLYEKAGTFTLEDALEHSAAKMIHRHPHVFGNVTFENRDEQLKAWEKIKREENSHDSAQPKGVFDSLPKGLPPLIKAYRLHSKAARAGFTWKEDEEVEQQVEAAWLEWLDASASGDKEAMTHELGDLLFSLVELGRRKGIKANECLDYAARRFLRRFTAMEALARQQQKDFTQLALDDQDELWNQVKAAEKNKASSAEASREHRQDTEIS